MIRILVYLASVTPLDDLVFRGATARDFNSALRWAGTALRLPVRFTIHCLRHGRATHGGHLRGDPPETIRLEGRWAVSHSMEIYLQACTALLLNLHAPPPLLPLLDLGDVLRAHILAFL